MAEDTGDKTEAPTPRRRQEAREQGNVARSPDLVAAVLLLSIMLMLNWYGPSLTGALRGLMQHTLSTFADSGTESISVTLLACLRAIAIASAPIFVGVIIA